MLKIKSWLALKQFLVFNASLHDFFNAQIHKAGVVICRRENEYKINLKMLIVNGSGLRSSKIPYIGVSLFFKEFTLINL